MTARADLPAAVVERVALQCPGPTMELARESTRSILAEFLAISREQPSILAPLLTQICEERGLRIVPVRKPTRHMNEQGQGADSTAVNGLIAHAVWVRMAEAAPPLAELLEDRRDAD